MKKFLIILILGLIAIQFIPVSYNNPTVVAEEDFFSIHDAPLEVKSLIHSACYDCHSNETKYPGYSKIAPINFWMKNHIEEGRRELNFSTWSNYLKNGKANHKLDECAEMIEKDEMPLKSYTWMHEEAKLTDTQKTLLIEYFRSLKNSTPDNQ